MSSGCPKVSVVTSVYNGDRYLRSGLDSVLSQEGVDFEFIVIDDGSTDGSVEMLKRVAANDSRVRLVRQENTGLTRALIRGCQMARGHYSARHDGDDISLPGRLRAQAARLDEDPSLAFVSCWSDVIGPGDEPLLTHRRPADPSDATRLLVEGRVGPPGHGSVMFRRDAYERAGGYRDIFYYAQDSDLWLRLSEQGRIAYLQKVLYRYRLAPDSMSASMHPAKEPYARLIEAVRQARRRGEDDSVLLREADLRPVVSKMPHAAPGATDYFIARCLLGRKDSRSLGYLRRAIAANPRHFRSWLLYMPAMALALFGSREPSR